MPADPLKRIQDAVRDGLTRCLHAPAPLPVLAAYLEELRAAGWSASEVHQVEVAVLRVVKAIMGIGDSSSGQDAE